VTPAWPPSSFRRFVLEVLPSVKLAFPDPLKVMSAPDAFGVDPPTPAVALKSSVPLFVKLPPIESLCVVIVLLDPDGALLKVEPELMIRLAFTDTVRAPTSPNCKMADPPWPTVNV